MNKIRYSVLFLLFALLTLFPVFSGQSAEVPQQSKVFLWEVQSDTSKTYIMGSIHFANPSFYPLDERIEKAFSDSSILVLELNPLTVDQQKMQSMVVSKGLYPGGDSIVNHISPKLYGDLERYLAENNLPVQAFANMRPGMLAIALSTVQLMKLGYSPTDGMDLYFAEKASGTKKILELETVEEQLSLLFNMPDENLMLQYTLKDLGNVEKLFTSIADAWKKGGSDAMDNLLLRKFDTYPELQPVVNRLFYERNKKMTVKVEELIKATETSFVVVGAGHLVGDKGIVQLLKDKGYSVRQL